MDRRYQASGSQPPKGFWFFLLWFLTCLLLFFWKIPPHPTQSFRYLVDSFKYSRWTWALVGTTWFHHGFFLLAFIGSMVVFCGTGAPLLERVGPLGLSFMEGWAWSLALGMGFWGLLAEGLAFENLFYGPLLRALMVLAFAGFLVFDRKEALRRCWPFQEPLGIPFFWLWPIAVVLLLSLSNLLAPEMSWDAITYQLVLPKFYFIEHGFYPVIGVEPAHYPSLGQMIFSWGMIWDNDSLARSFSFLAHLGTALALVGIGNRFFSKKVGLPGEAGICNPVPLQGYGRQPPQASNLFNDAKVGWIAAAFYWVFPYLNLFSTRGYVDLFTGFYSVLGLGYLMVWGKEENRQRPGLGILASMALGLAWAVKYNAVSFWLAGVLLFWTCHRGSKTDSAVAAWLWGGPLFFFGPWALKSWFYVHDPVYPHLAGIFQPLDWTPFDAQASAIKFPMEGLGGLLQAPLLPWKIVFENYGGAPNEEVSLVPFILLPVLLLYLVLKWKELLWKRPFLIVVGIPFFFWLVTTHQLRLITGSLALANLPLAAVYQWVAARWGAFERALSVLVGVLFWVCAFYLFQGLANQPTPFACSLGFQSREEFFGHVLRPDGYMTVADTLSQTLPSDAKVLIIGQQNGYYLDRVSAYDFDYTYPVLKKWSETSDTPEELYKRFRENGFTHILYNANSMLGTAIRVSELGINRYPWKPPELKNFEQFFLKFTRKIPLPVGHGYSFYEVGPRDGFSELPDFLPGTELYYVEDIQRAMGLAQLSDLAGQNVPADAYLQTYQLMSEQHPEIGLPCFQWSFAAMGGSPDMDRQALEMGREGFKRNGDEAAWDDLRAADDLVRKKMSAAIPLLEEAQRLSPEREDVARNLAVAYYNEHELGKASREADLAASLAPYSQDYQNLAQELRSLLKDPMIGKP